MKKIYQNDELYYMLTPQEFNNWTEIMRTLRRIVKERSNVRRELRPKKERSGYIMLSYDTNDFIKKNGKTTLRIAARRLLVETPYDGRLNYSEARDAIISELKETFLEQFGAKYLLDGDKIKSTAIPENSLIYSGLELQRNGQWSVRLYANYSPDIPRDMLLIED